MKKVFYHLFFLLALAGCAKEEHVAVSDGVPGGAGFKFELTTEDSTRAITDENFKTSFTEGDQGGAFRCFPHIRCSRKTFSIRKQC